MPLLYIHPHGHMNELAVPMGAFSCVNEVKGRKAGKFAFEVTPNDIMNADLIATDVHWALAVAGFEKLVHHIRDLRPGVPIVVGGITAGYYAHQFLSRYPVDYVIRGDSERPFALLVEALKRGREPGPIPNIFSKKISDPPLQRMTREEFDQTDSVTTDWFPTYDHFADWEAICLPHSRHVSVTRGCRLRCPGCYGSFASIFGPGHLVRSPESVVNQVRRAEKADARFLNLFFGKPAQRRITDILDALAQAGPFKLSGDVALFVCSPLTPQHMDRLEAAFPNRVTISFIPPEEHVPKLKPETLAAEKDALRKLGQRVAQSKKLALDVFTLASADTKRIKRQLVDTPSPRVTVSYGATWCLTRPTDHDAANTFNRVREAVLPFWTFYAGRLLSPALAAMLAPYRYLDHLDADPKTVECPAEILRPFYNLSRANWQRHRLPNLPGLSFSLVPLAGNLPPRVPAAPHEVHLRSAMEYIPPDTLETLETGTPSPMKTVVDHKGATLTCEVELPSGTPAVAFFPQLDNDVPKIDELFRYGVAAMRLPAEINGTLWLEAVIRVQSAQIAAGRKPGEVRVRGGADLAFVKPPP